MILTTVLPWLAMLAASTGDLAGNAFDRFAWLAGHWGGEGPAGASGVPWHEEIWSPPIRLSMTAVSITGVGEKERSRELLEIRPGVGGAIMLHARPSGQKHTRFQLRLPVRDRELVFENRYHDYPQRIVYRREGEVLTATISLMDGSRARSWTYRLQPPG